MPFMLSSSLSASLRSCGLLLLLNGVYYVRAKTEERHLALDPVYIEYAAWIRAHGLLRFLDGLPVIGALARWRPGFAAGGDLPQRDTTAQYDHLPYTPGPRSRIGHEHKPKGPAARIVRR
jgi:hypothetical protein